MPAPIAPLRTFVALTPAPDVRAAIHRATAALRASLGTAVRWVAEPELHVTLKFLGDQSPEDVDRLVAALHLGATGVSRVRLAFAGLGAFPSIRRPRVIWLGLEPNPTLGALYQWVESTTTSVGMAPDERAFHPHLTLGRVRDVRGYDELPLAREAAALEFRAESAIRAVDVLESVVGTPGSRYRTIATIALGEGIQED